jgi:cinnamoyl-CoA reductase
MSTSTTTTVCVTGGSGFLGAMTVKLCLERGWNVRTTTRSPLKHQNRLENLVPNTKDRLTIYQADLLTTDFTNIFQGCDVVMHTASPFFVEGATEKNVVVPAVQGTQNVLDACHRANIKYVCLTSSTASIYAWYGMHPVDHVMVRINGGVGGRGQFAPFF